MPIGKTPRTADGRSAATPLLITPESHVDHGLSPAILEWIVASFSGRSGLFIETVTLPEHLGEILCALHGPAVGDPPVPESDVVYEKRGDRGYPSRLCAREMRRTRTLTVIGGPYENKQILYSAFGGPRAAMEPADPRVRSENLDFCQKFWAEHALSIP